MVRTYRDIFLAVAATLQQPSLQQITMPLLLLREVVSGETWGEWMFIMVWLVETKDSFAW